MRVSLSLLLLACGLPAAAADNWPAFRGPTGDGVSTATNIPTTWTETENVRWKTPIHDKGWSSPVVWGDQVWLTTARADGTKYFAVCLDKNTGKVVHDIPLFDAAKPANTAQYNSYASPTPCVEEGRVYVHFGSYGTACLDTKTGQPVWKRTDLPCDHFRGPASSPVVYKNKLFLLFDGFDQQYVACLDKATGETVWRKDRKLPYPDNGDFKKAYATPAVFEIDGKPQVVCPAAMGTIAHDVETGDEVWRVVHDGMNEACRPVMAHGLIYLTIGHKNGLIAVKAGRTGDLTKDGIAWRLDKVGATRPSPIVVGELLFMVNDTGILFCLDAKTGKKHWEERLQGKFSASPVLVEGKLYLLSEGGKVFVVEATKTYNPVATNALDVGGPVAHTAPPIFPIKADDLRCMASPAVVDGALFLRSPTHLYCVGKK